jgi:hypothetical protein
MKKSIYINLLFTLITLAFPLSLYSQTQLIVTLNNNNTETFSLSEIQSIKFGSQNMNIRKYDGNIFTWGINDIANYRFEDFTNLKKMEQTIGNLKVYPNPINEQTIISFTSTINQEISIEIVDLSGRTVLQLFKGNQSGNQNISWQPDLNKGMYLLKVIAQNRLYTQSIIIK